MALLARGANPDAALADGWTALMLAAQEGHAATAAALLAGGADADAVAAYGLTALMLAATNGYVETAAVLLLGGATLDAARLDGSTALPAAAAFPDMASVQVLLDACALAVERSLAWQFADELAVSAAIGAQGLGHFPAVMADAAQRPWPPVEGQADAMDEVLSLGWSSSAEL